MTRFTFDLYGSHRERKTKEREPCPNVTGKGSRPVTSFFDKFAGVVTLSPIRVRWCGKAERGALVKL
jgi:hypothetical protein